MIDMQKRFVVSLFILFSFLFIRSTGTHAQVSTDPAMPQKAIETIRYPGQNMPVFFGHEHAYTVTLRGNGEAHVVLKAAFTNSTEATTSAVLFKVPKVELKDMVVYQVIREGNCMVYKQNTITRADFSIPLCEKYDEPNYFEPYYYGNVTYKKTTAGIEGDGIKVTLAQDISPEKSGSIILFYTTEGYTTKTIFGGYDFKFETLKVAEPIRSLQVGINTDTNLNIKGVASEVQYRDVFTPSIAMQEFSKGYSTDSTSQYFGQIGTGRLIKNAYELQPNETFTVEGMYGRTWWNLYAMETIIGILLVILAGGVIIFFLKKLYGKIMRSMKNESSEESMPKNKQNVLVVLGLSFVSSFLITAYSIFQFFILSLIQRQYYDSTITLFIGLVLFIISLLIYGFLFVGPPLFVGIKKGTMWGIGTFVATLTWLFMYVLIFLLLTVYLRTMMSDRYSPMQVTAPYLEGVQKMVPSVGQETVTK